MNARRIAAIHRELASLHAELADAYEQTEPKRKRKKHIAAPEVEPSKEALERAQRLLRRAGVAA